MKAVVGFSGGADSQACLRWCRNELGDENVIALNSDAGGNEHPVTEEFIRQYSKKVFPIVTVRAIIADLGNRGTRPGQTRDRREEFNDDEDLTFERLAYIKGCFPSKKKQFCTEHLKLAPQRRWMQENLVANGVTFERYSGVRRDESDTRKNTPLLDWDEYFDCIIRCPLADWTKQEVFTFLDEAGEEINPLYRMGFSRVGCAPCINPNKDDVRLWAARFPEMIDKVRRWERKVGRTFYMPCVPGLKINWIDDVVAWSRTAHGGRQPLLAFVEADAAAGACSSKYGLCE